MRRRLAPLSFLSNLDTLIPLWYQSQDPTMATPVQSSITISQSMIPILVRLDDDNFLTWKMQAMNTIKAHKLQKFISEENLGGMPRR
ncbi:hypothetical protein CR513_08183, partial [Mucuna pruriens]